jgi:D-beta-D-heptose 7-phosphate kinase/D-beta-D-heptose 1-phosphate adenosyltransferase
MSFTVPDFSRVGVLVAGDVMLDEYWFGPTSRISPEAPVPIVRLTGTEQRPGGAANVAINLATLGARTTLTGLVGSDDSAAVLRELLRNGGVTEELLPGRASTITKLRILSRNQQLIRLDTETIFPPEDAQPLVGTLERLLPRSSVCVLSDYGKGTLAQVDTLIGICRRRAVPVLVDPKGTDFDRYRGATVLTPNLAEFEAVVGRTADDADLVTRADALRDELELGALVITLGERGMVVVGAGRPPLFLNARARQVFDVSGAGDTVIAALAASVGAGLPLIEAAQLANLAAGLVVGKIGTASVSPSEIRLALHAQGLSGRGGLLRRPEARQVAAEARSRGERIVMTNGCFDILHAGHVAYLEEAKARGDRLLVAVNDDASVARLKGAGRPINPLADRMAVLSALAAVDWVVPFAEDTPESLVTEIMPDVLVKGGDYRPENIAGARIVLNNGGKVEVLPFHDGRSTSGIIAALRRLPQV